MSDNSEQIMLILGEIRGEVKGVNQRLDKLNGRTEKTENKVNELENDRAKALGIVTGVTSVVSLGWAFVTYYFK